MDTYSESVRKPSQADMAHLQQVGMSEVKIPEATEDEAI